MGPPGGQALLLQVPQPGSGQALGPRRCSGTPGWWELLPVLGLVVFMCLLTGYIRQLAKKLLVRSLRPFSRTRWTQARTGDQNWGQDQDKNQIFWIPSVQDRRPDYCWRLLGQDAVRKGRCLLCSSEESPQGAECSTLPSVHTSAQQTLSFSTPSLLPPLPSLPPPLPPPPSPPSLLPPPLSPSTYSSDVPLSLTTQHTPSSAHYPPHPPLHPPL